MAVKFIPTLAQSPASRPTVSSWTPTLHLCVGKGDISGTQLALDHGADPNARDKDGVYPVIHAVETKNLELLRLLIAAHANVNVVSPDGNTPLHLAVKSKNLEMVNTLVDAGADVNAKDKSGMTPAMLAVWMHSLPILELLVKTKADLNAVKTDQHNSRRGYVEQSLLDMALQQKSLDIVRFLVANDTTTSLNSLLPCLLHTAVEKNDLALIELLAKRNADFNVVLGSWGTCCRLRDRTALHLAVDRKNLDLVKALLAGGAKPTIKHGQTKTPFEDALQSDLTTIIGALARASASFDAKYEAEHANELRLWTAVLRGDLDELRRRIDAGDSVDQAPQGGKAKGWTALWLAVALGREDAARMLIQAGANVKCKCSRNTTLVLMAIEHRNLELLELLAKAGADVETTNQGGDTPLIITMRAHMTGMTEVLIDAGADVNAKSKDRMAPVLLSVKLAEPNILLLLVKAGADLGVRTGGGNTALHRAVEAANLEMVKILVDARVSVNAKGGRGMTPAMLAAQLSDSSILSFLISKRVDLKIQDKDSNTALHHAVSTRHLDNTRLLIKAGANINAKNKSGMTPAMLALRSRMSDMLELLVKAGADLTIQDNEGYTALHQAISSYQLCMTKMLVEAGSDINMKDKEGMTPVMLAATIKLPDGYRYNPNRCSKVMSSLYEKSDMEASSSILTYLISQNVDLTAKDSLGDTALHHAVGRANIENTKILINAGAEINAKDKHGYTPLMLALDLPTSTPRTRTA